MRLHMCMYTLGFCDDKTCQFPMSCAQMGSSITLLSVFGVWNSTTVTSCSHAPY